MKKSLLDIIFEKPNGGEIISLSEDEKLKLKEKRVAAAEMKERRINEMRKSPLNFSLSKL